LHTQHSILSQAGKSATPKADSAISDPIKIKIRISMRQHKLNRKIEKHLKKIKDCTGSIQYYPMQANLPHPHSVSAISDPTKKKSEIPMRKHKPNP
jgi:hypothetical protein